MRNSSIIAAFCAALGDILRGFNFLFTRVGLSVAPNPNVMLSHRFILATSFMGILILTGKGNVFFNDRNTGANSTTPYP